MSGGAQINYEQEIRFAVVLYGGVSLAVYINGVAQEFLRLVRSTAAGNSAPDGTELIYREISEQLGHKGLDTINTGQPRVRFVVDIISGTSAGGINGIALAKCLALGAPDMNALQQTWLNDAQIDNLFNDKGGTGPAKINSVLDGQHMYELVHSSLTNMNVPDDKATKCVDQVDLFVTATDLRGLVVPLQLADGSIPERVHKAKFQFTYVCPDYAKLTGIDDCNHFEEQYDPMLAFAARCTSSFPVAFEPMEFANIKSAIGSVDFESLKATCAPFFDPFIKRGSGFGTRDIPLENRQFADGGYLDNRPFSYAIDLIQYRTSTIPVQRKLMFVDPFPEYASDEIDTSRVDFIENAELALTTLPRYQAIRGDIDRINENNRRQDRLQALLDDLYRLEDAERPAEDRTPTMAGIFKSASAPRAAVDGRPAEPTHSGLANERSYIALRQQVATTDLAAGFVKVMGFEAGSDQEYFLSLILRAWRDENYPIPQPQSEPKGDLLQPAIRFLAEFDLEFERRRLNDLVTLIDRRLSGGGNLYEPPLFEGVTESTLLALRDRLNAILVQLGQLKKRVLASVATDAKLMISKMTEPFHQLMAIRDRGERYSAAKGIYDRLGSSVDNLMASVQQPYSRNLIDSRAVVLDILQGCDAVRLLLRYQSFEQRDSITLPYLDGTGSKEHTAIEVYRISPADTSLCPSSVARADKKLAGISVDAFGGFLEEAWRQNDMMWGRLDGAERIIAAILPNSKDAEVKKKYVAKAQDVILAESLTGRNSGVFFNWLIQKMVNHSNGKPTPAELQAYAQKYFPNALDKLPVGSLRQFIQAHYDVPPPPKPESVLSWTSRVLGIFSKMIDDLPPSEGQGVVAAKISGALRWGSLFIVQAVQFGIPDTLGSLLLRWWLLLIALSSALLLVVGLVTGIQSVQAVGLVALGAVILVWIVQREFIRLVLRRQGGRAQALAALAIIAFVLVPWVIGLIEVIIFARAKGFWLWH